MPLEFLLTSLVVVLLPGTGVIYTLAIGLGRGFKASVAAAFGCTFGIVPAAVASILGLAALLHTSALAFQIIKYLGVLYLFYMAWSILKDGGAMDVSEERSQKSLGSIAVTGTLINVLNPKLSLFFLAFLPQFVSADSVNATVELVLLAVVFMVMTLWCS
jgi:threonine/homoserine/homoserine lactone efflux protein